MNIFFTILHFLFLTEYVWLIMFIPCWWDLFLLPVGVTLTTSAKSLKSERCGSPRFKEVWNHYATFGFIFLTHLTLSTMTMQNIQKWTPLNHTTQATLLNSSTLLWPQPQHTEQQTLLGTLLSDLWPFTSVTYLKRSQKMQVLYLHWKLPVIKTFFFFFFENGFCDFTVFSQSSSRL